MHAQKQQGEEKDSDGLGRAQRQVSNARECTSSCGENDESQALGCCECDRVAEIQQCCADEANCDDGDHKSRPVLDLSAVL
jgi:hypothetical protein